MTRITESPQAVDDLVVLAVPATGEYLGVLRTATAGLAARLDFTLDEIEDLRIAVDEACAMLLPLAGSQPDETTLTCRFLVREDALSVEACVPVDAAEPGLPAGDSFAWQVLNALADKVSAQTTEHEAVIRLSKLRPNG